ncbi:MAG TPA: hypothetical protein VNF24_01630 [Candidatus Acidoferrales bacterium]|nr:hypothetical protein [Candidatus Acidoferrales bacterium]
MGFKDLYKSIDEKSKAVAADLQAKAAEKSPMVDKTIAAAKEAAASAAARANEYGKQHGLGSANPSGADTSAVPGQAGPTDESATNSSWVPPAVGPQGNTDKSN